MLENRRSSANLVLKWQTGEVLQIFIRAFTALSRGFKFPFAQTGVANGNLILQSNFGWIPNQNLVKRATRLQWKFDFRPPKCLKDPPYSL
jgi:hypothetical protein